MHTSYCFAGQPAPEGYFYNDILPCVCGSKEKLLLALGQAAIPYEPVMQAAPPEVHLLPLSA